MFLQSSHTIWHLYIALAAGILLILFSSIRRFSQTRRESYEYLSAISNDIDTEKKLHVRLTKHVTEAKIRDQHLEKKLKHIHLDIVQVDDSYREILNHLSQDLNS